LEYEISEEEAKRVGYERYSDEYGGVVTNHEGGSPHDAGAKCEKCTGERANLAHGDQIIPLRIFRDLPMASTLKLYFLQIDVKSEGERGTGRRVAVDAV
jgi:hypothetical protein